MLAICTAMFVFSVALSTLLQTTFISATELAKNYAGLIIVLIGVPFGLCALITSFALVLNSQRIWSLSKYGLAISCICLLLTIVWIGLGVYLEIPMEAISNTLIPTAGVGVVVAFFVIFVWAGISAQSYKSQIMKAFRVLRSRTKYFDTIIWIESPSTTLLGRDLLHGEPDLSGGYTSPSIQGWSYSILQEKGLSLSDFEGMANRNILLIVENKQVINCAVPLIKETKGNVVGCLIVNQEVIAPRALDKIEKDIGFPVTVVKKNVKDKRKK
jgi:hypothetical protein